MVTQHPGLVLAQVVDDNLRAVQFDGGDHPAILPRLRRLERLAAAGAFTPLGAFESYDPGDAPEFTGAGEPAAPPPVQWFDPAAGRAAVDALVAHLAAHPGALADQGAVAADLAAVAAELAAGERAGVRFRFAVVP